MPFTIICPSKPSYKSGDVLRITKCVKGSSERTLEAKSWTNFMLIEKWFKVHKKFHQKIENESHPLTDVILGFYKCENQQTDDGHFGGGQDDNYTEQVNEREYAMSRITDKVFDHYQSMTIHDILYTPVERHPKGEFIIENLYKTRFFVVGIMPDNLLEICQLFCKRCFNTFSFKKFMKTTPTCTTCSDA